jgi:hypothetical protein
LFWDYNFSQLTWIGDRDLIIGRILAAGDWEAVQWLVRRLGRPALKDWLCQRRGAGLSPQQLRFWEIVLKLPRRQVDAWLANPGRILGDRRRHD